MQQPGIDLSKTTAVNCEKCNHNVFQEGVMLRFVSRFVSFQDKDSYGPIPVFACMACGHVNDQFIPKELKIQSED